MPSNPAPLPPRTFPGPAQRLVRAGVYGPATGPRCPRTRGCGTRAAVWVPWRLLADARRCPRKQPVGTKRIPRPPDSGDSPPPPFAVFWEPSGARRTRARRAGGGRRPGTQLRRSSRLTGGTGVDYPAGLGSSSEPIWGDPAMPRPLSRPGPTRMIPCALRGRRRKVSGYVGCEADASRGGSEATVHESGSPPAPRKKWAPTQRSAVPNAVPVVGS